MGNTAYKESSAPPCQVDDLMAVMHQVKRHPAGYRGIHLHFSLLERSHKQPYHRRAIATAFNKLVQNKNGQLFWTRNFDAVFICKNCSSAQLDIAIVAARRAVEDSPLVKKFIEAGQDDNLCDWYDLEKDLTRFLKMIEGLKDPVEQKTPSGLSLKSMVHDLKNQLSESDDTPDRRVQSMEAVQSRYIPRSQRDIPVVPMGPVQLAQLERNLINVEIFRMMMDQVAYVIAGKSKPQPIFVEHYVSVEAISKKLLPGYDMLADKWLFQRLTRTFDRKLLHALAEKDLTPGQAISVNINVETVFTPMFDEFIAKLRVRNNQPLILEMRLFDVISDIQKFYEARDKLARLGCRISLDTIDINALMVLDRELLAVDFLKVSWNSNYKALLGGPMEEKIISAIAVQGKMRIILCHCDSEDALDFGKAVGIHMYQGFLIDKKFGS